MMNFTKWGMVLFIAIILMVHAGPAHAGWRDATNGTENSPIYTVTDTNVGIGMNCSFLGCATPRFPLHVIGAGGFGPEDSNGIALGGSTPIVAQSTSNSTVIGILNAEGRQAFALNIDGDGGTTTARGIPTFYDKCDGSWHNSISLRNGLVGIGTPYPASRLEVFNNTVTEETSIRVNNQASPGFASAVDLVNASNVRWLLRAGGSSRGDWARSAFDIVEGSGGIFQPRIHVAPGGNVGIGTTNPQSLLAVKGTITATGIKVTSSGWSDFVFDKGYKLPSLDKVEAYVKENKHLPDIPSAREITKDGIDVPVMLAKQMQKIEELTLYTIELKKQNEAQTVKIDAQSSQINDLQAKIAQMNVLEARLSTIEKNSSGKK